MQSIINSFIAALALYTGIPMPIAACRKENRRYVLFFFPLIGFVIGWLLGIWSRICEECGFGQVCFALVGAVIPVFVTGGVHLEAFLDTANLLHFEETKKRRPKRIKTAQSGVYPVIAAGCFFMLYGAGLTLIWKEEQLILLGLSFVISRILSGMSQVWFPAAKEEEQAYAFISEAHRRMVRVVLTALLVISFISAVLIQPVIGALMALAAMWVWTYYFYMSKKRFGGMTDDLAGYFLCLCELSSVLVIGMLGRIM